jgi:DNA helicase II / ATP-dependent DNA helicase PcrA
VSCGLVSQLAQDLQWLAANLNQDAHQTLQQLEARLGYTRFLRATSGLAQTGNARAAGVEAFIDYAAGQGSLQQFLSHIRTLSQERARQAAEDTAGENSRPAVTLSTIHGAKGLEWTHVFIPQCNQATIPFLAPESDNLEEERRLFYVALTRTRQDVYLYCLSSDPISQFLQEAK